MNLSAMEKRGSAIRLLGLPLGSSTYYLYEFETNYLTAWSHCEVGLIVNAKAVVNIVDNKHQVLSPEPDNTVGTC